MTGPSRSSPFDVSTHDCGAHATGATQQIGAPCRTRPRRASHARRTRAGRGPRGVGGAARWYGLPDRRAGRGRYRRGEDGFKIVPFTDLANLRRSGAIAKSGWSTKDSERLYNLHGWGLGFFRVNAEGNLTVHPDLDPARGLDLYHLATDLSAQGVGLPLLIRFSDILKTRIEALARNFQAAIDEFG
jgi:hypothetical protein